MAKKAAASSLSTPVAASAILAQWNKTYGSGSISLLANNEDAYRITKMATGIYTLDKMLSGGIPAGKLTEIYGADGVGKTSLALQIASNMLSQPENANKLVVWADAEFSLSADFIAQTYKIPADRFAIIRQTKETPAEVVLDILIEAARANDVCLVVLDSVASLVLGADYDKNLQDGTMAAQRAAVLHRTCRYLESREKNTPPVIFLNQVQDRVGGMGHGPQTTTPGGRALRHYASLRLELIRINTLKNTKETEIGFAAKAVARKARYSTPSLSCIYHVVYGEGVDVVGSVIDLALEANIITRSGTYYTIAIPGNGETFHGREKLKAAIAADQILFKDLCARVEDLVLPDTDDEERA